VGYLAVGAAAQDGEVMGVNVKAVPATSCSRQVIEEVSRKFDHRLAVLANEMAMRQSGQTVDGRSVA
jgi:hypothetical protein